MNVVKFETKYAQWNRTRAQKHHVFRSERFNINHYDRLWYPKDTILIYFFEQKLSKYLLGAGRSKNLEICTKENNKKL